jgi:hypothetical protein
MLKKKGMKTTGKKATLMKRLHMRGGWSSSAAFPFAAGGQNTMGPVSPAGNQGEPTLGSAREVSSELTRDQQNGGRRRRR